MPEFTMTIDGKAVKGSKTVGVINPATGKVFAQVPDCTKAELDQAMEAAQRAYPAWSRDVGARKKVLNDIGAALMQMPEGLARTITQEQGKPLDKAGQEIVGAAIWAQYTAGLDLDPPQAAWRGRRDHSVELPTDARDVENRSRAAGRKHGGAQAFAVHADQYADAR
jgi:acyl-CoA reductase-like NAD-dependent aldehyde dehydrogenase